MKQLSFLLLFSRVPAARAHSPFWRACIAATSFSNCAFSVFTISAMVLLSLPVNLAGTSGANR